MVTNIKRVHAIAAAWKDETSLVGNRRAGAQFRPRSPLQPFLERPALASSLELLLLP